MSEDALKAQIDKLKLELEKKDREINKLKEELEKRYKENDTNLDRIEELEETIMRLEDLIPEEDGKKKNKKKQVIDSKLAIELDEKDKQIRELKNNMGFLRKEKVHLQQELDRIKSENKNSSVIRVEDLRRTPPLNVLVKELQDKINKQQSIIKRYTSQKVSNEDFSEKLKEKEEEIESYKLENLELNQKLKELSIASEDTSSDSITKALIEDLQNKLNRAKIQISSLQKQLKKYQVGKTPESGKAQKELEGEFKMQREMAISLQKQLETKEGEIETIKNEAVQIKRRYRQLENQLRLKDQKLNDIQRQLDSFNIQTQVQPKREDPHVALRIRELKKIVDELEKQNIEQRLEISQLRKKI
ncbi:MAG: hypothetical protein JSV23_00300 [Promethearchaeota archaeon]|nr:MAG: hypothetical protein JSV23_00300 [Candidatus Lokiarchaeota archaeon]